MAPIDQSLVDTLKDTIDKLEARVLSLESRLQGKAEELTGNDMRMILIGPPGAGMFFVPTQWLLQPREYCRIGSR